MLITTITKSCGCFNILSCSTERYTPTNSIRLKSVGHCHICDSGVLCFLRVGIFGSVYIGSAVAAPLSICFNSEEQPISLAITPSRSVDRLLYRYSLLGFHGLSLVPRPFFRASVPYILIPIPATVYKRLLVIQNRNQVA